MFKLPKRKVLRKNKNFQTVYKVGKSYANKLLVLYVLSNRKTEGRIGFAAGKKMGNAVVRNRVKRLLREAYRLNQHRISPGLDLVLVGRKPIIGENLKTVAGALLHICGRAGVLAE